MTRTLTPTTPLYLRAAASQGADSDYRPGDGVTPYRINLDDAGELDEVFATGKIHVERMAEGAWWIGITTEDGTELHVNFTAKNQRRTTVRGTGWAEPAATEAE